MFERPGPLRCFPAWVLPDHRGGGGEIRLIVGAEVEAGFVRGMLAQTVEEFRLDEAVLVMPLFGPRVGKEDEHRGEGGASRQGLEEKMGVGVQKMQVRGLRALLFSRGSRDAIGLEVEAKTESRRMGLRIGDEKMAVATAEFTHELLGPREKLGERGLKLGLSLLDGRQEAVGSLRVFHDSVERCADHSPDSPLPDSTQTIRILISAGLTPLIRLAWPSVMGLISVNFWALSFLKPLTEK